MEIIESGLYQGNDFPVVSGVGLTALLYEHLGTLKPGQIKFFKFGNLEDLVRFQNNLGILRDRMHLRFKSRRDAKNMVLYVKSVE